MGTSVADPVVTPVVTGDVIAAAATIPTDTTPPVTEAPTTEVTYDLKLPGDLAELKDLIDPTILERTAAIARARGLDNEAGQSVLDFTLAETKTVAQKAAEAAVKAADEAWIAANAPPANGKPGGAEWVKRNEQWWAQAQADPAIGGTKEKFAVSVEQANQAVTKFGTPALKTMLEQTGFGSHPEVLRFLASIGKAASEPGLVLGGAPVAAKKSAADLLYDNPTSQKPAA
jgi:hypothetical protein